MVITHENMRRWQMNFWCAEPVMEPAPAGYIRFDLSVPPFPNLAELSPSDRKKLRRLLARHPEYLLTEVIIDSKQAIQ